MTTRRQFVLTAVPATAILLGVARTASGQPAKLEETDPLATALAYRADATTVDAKKYPTWAKDHTCANCQFFGGKPNDATGACAAVGGKLVNAKGWCTAWVKKA
jgi:hypothetical protein